MKPSRREDVTSILAIAWGAVVSVALTAAFLARGPAEHATLYVRGSVSGQAMMIPDGYRAVTVPVHGAASAGLTRPGSRVDVLVRHDASEAAVNAEMQLVLQNVLVLGSDRSISRGNDGQTVQLMFVTLLVTPEEAERLAMAETKGRLYFAVRDATLIEVLSSPR
jgi:pilus assembly protein CpaB